MPAMPATQPGTIIYKDVSGFEVSTAGIGTTSTSTCRPAAPSPSRGRAVKAAGLRLLGSGPYTLTETTNAVGTVAGNTTGAISFVQHGDLSIGTVTTTAGTTAGLTSGGTATLTSSAGTIAPDGAISTGANLLTVSAATVSP
jgi:hypothetical protein